MNNSYKNYFEKLNNSQLNIIVNSILFDGSNVPKGNRLDGTSWLKYKSNKYNLPEEDQNNFVNYSLVIMNGFAEKNTVLIDELFNRQEKIITKKATGESIENVLLQFQEIKNNWHNFNNNYLSNKNPLKVPDFLSYVSQEFITLYDDVFHNEFQDINYN